MPQLVQEPEVIIPSEIFAYIAEARAFREKCYAMAAEATAQIELLKRIGNHMGIFTQSTQGTQGKVGQ